MARPLPASPLGVEFQSRRGEKKERKLCLLLPLQGVADGTHPGRVQEGASDPQPKGEVAQVAADGVLQLQAAPVREAQVRGERILWKKMPRGEGTSRVQQRLRAPSKHSGEPRPGSSGFCLSLGSGDSHL